MPPHDNTLGCQPSSAADTASAIGGIITPVIAARAGPTRCASLK